ncbi:MAG: hypothetical protein DMG70_10930 [Acidobacteria bacterium]|nr:MAG: hypothetical protein DMG70_10930 [Acidobacteriota bacterium]
MLFECNPVPRDYRFVEGESSVLNSPMSDCSKLPTSIVQETADFDCSRSGSFRTAFGARLRLLFATGSGLLCRGEKRDPLPDLVTSSVYR